MRISAILFSRLIKILCQNELHIRLEIQETTTILQVPLTLEVVRYNVHHVAVYDGRIAAYGCKKTQFIEMFGILAW
jgi:hypothetical protein